MELSLLITSIQMLKAMFVLVKELYDVSVAVATGADEWKSHIFAFSALPSGGLWGADGLRLHMSCDAVCECGEEICLIISHA